jgi:hypothetical protein
MGTALQRALPIALKEHLCALTSPSRSKKLSTTCLPLQWDMTPAMEALPAFRRCRHRARLPVLSPFFSSRRSFQDSRAILLLRCLDARPILSDRYLGPYRTACFIKLQLSIIILSLSHTRAEMSIAIINYQALAYSHSQSYNMYKTNGNGRYKDGTRFL